MRFLLMKPDVSSRRVVVFDMDDTLFPEADFVRSGFQAVARFLEEKTGKTGFFEKAWARFQSGERGSIFDGALSDCDMQADKAFIKELVAVYRTHRPNIALDDWVRPLFSQLRQSGRKIGVITDGPVGMQAAKAEALGLDGLVDAVVLSDAIGGESTRKPTPAPYESIMRTLGAAPAECVYIGDNPSKDFIGARRVGWTSVRLRIPGRLHSDIEPPNEYAADIETGSGRALAALLSAY